MGDGWGSKAREKKKATKDVGKKEHSYDRLKTLKGTGSKPTPGETAREKKVKRLESQSYEREAHCRGGVWKREG